MAEAELELELKDELLDALLCDELRLDETLLLLLEDDDATEDDTDDA